MRSLISKLANKYSDGTSNILECRVFEYDLEKSQRNQSKHAIDFEQAQLLWNDPLRVEIRAKSTTEPRFMVIGRIDGKYWSAIATYKHPTYFSAAFP